MWCMLATSWNILTRTKPIALSQRFTEYSGREVCFEYRFPIWKSAAWSILERLEAALAEPSDVNLKKYRWAVLDLIDQNARDRPGGIMFECLQQGDFDPDYLKHRYGDVFSKYWSKFERSKQESVRVSQSKLDRMTHHLKRPRQTLYALLRKWFIFLKASDPRAIGETNGWMYDRLSIKRLMEGAELCAGIEKGS